MGKRLIDPRFDGMLRVLHILREKREYRAHQRAAPEVRAYGIAHRLIRAERFGEFHEQTIEECAYETEVAAAIICMSTGENPGDVTHLGHKEQLLIVERGRELVESLPPDDTGEAPRRRADWLDG